MVASVRCKESIRRLQQRKISAVLLSWFTTSLRLDLALTLCESGLSKINPAAISFATVISSIIEITNSRIAHSDSKVDTTSCLAKHLQEPPQIIFTVMFTNHYQALDVPVTATADDIKIAYKRLALERHPDNEANYPRATAIFQTLQASYEIPRNAQERAKYDLENKTAYKNQQRRRYKQNNQSTTSSNSLFRPKM